MQKSIISHDSLSAILPKKDPVEAVLRRVMQGPALEGQGGHRRRCEVRVQGDLLKWKTRCFSSAKKHSKNKCDIYTLTYIITDYTHNQYSGICIYIYICLKRERVQEMDEQWWHDRLTFKTLLQNQPAMEKDVFRKTSGTRYEVSTPLSLQTDQPTHIRESSYESTHMKHKVGWCVPSYLITIRCLYPQRTHHWLASSLPCLLWAPVSFKETPDVHPIFCPYPSLEQGTFLKLTVGYLSNAVRLDLRRENLRFKCSINRGVKGKVRYQ